jgi:hypothetical protein
MAFEQLVAEAAAKKETKKKGSKDKDKKHDVVPQTEKEKVAADAPNVPRS